MIPMLNIPAVGSLPQASHLVSATFLAQPTVPLARQLLGHTLWLNTLEAPGIWLRIVETEAYTADDPACHAYQKNTGRAAMLYQPPGTAYVYQIYGMYYCLNIITEPEGIAGAVLIRALEPLHHPELKTHGPGRLCKALGLNTGLHNGHSLLDLENAVVLVQGPPVAEEQVVTTTRIGLSKAVDFPWRFYERGNPWVSVRIKGDTARKREAPPSP